MERINDFQLPLFVLDDDIAASHQDKFRAGNVELLPLRSSENMLSLTP